MPVISAQGTDPCRSLEWPASISKRDSDSKRKWRRDKKKSYCQPLPSAQGKPWRQMYTHIFLHHTH